MQETRLRILVLGTGGREHALAWKLGTSASAAKVFLHPGNAGSAPAFPSLGNQVGTSPEALVEGAKREEISLVVIGPEVLLAEGVADAFRKAGFPVVGPNQAAARLETSKLFAKEFMVSAHIPTAPYFTAESLDSLITQLGERRSWPVVLKLDGLAAGKGVVIAQSRRDVEDFASRIWKLGEFGPGPHTVVIEEFIEGREVSYIGLCDGEVFVPLASATDYKRVGDGNLGPNTGGMGSVSPSPYFNSELEKKITTRVIEPILSELKRRKLDFRGVLYCGLMIDASGNPNVLEFNTRFGDPETQAILPRLESDFPTLLLATARAELSKTPPPKWSSRVSLYVVAAAEGYPLTPHVGDAISGVDTISADTTVFYSGVKGGTDGTLLTGGGRVLGLGTLAENFAVAREKLYRDLKRVYFRGMHYRSDIGGGF